LSKNDAAGKHAAAWCRCADARGLSQGKMTPMSPAKEQLIRVIQEQPDDSSSEEILRELEFAAMVERGIADSDAGRTISNEEMAHRIESWRK
jgi:predicted transcriptional regulator